MWWDVWIVIQGTTVSQEKPAEARFVTKVKARPTPPPIIWLARQLTSHSVPDAVVDEVR
jgi:hypothetical protein